jgi:L-lysine exporter family protein LysE/ArgO
VFWAFVKGFGIGGSLIIAIGAQNAFLLSHALRRQHAFTIAFVCILVDASLITLGVWGVGQFVESRPTLLMAITIAGAVFLFAYGCIAFNRARHPQALVANTDIKVLKRTTVIVTTLALSLLNPHVYLDTVLLVGSIGGQLPYPNSASFAAGAIAASIVWFLTLAFAGRLLAPVFSQPHHWQRLDIVIALVMWAISLSLFWSFYQQLG